MQWGSVGSDHDRYVKALFFALETNLTFNRASWEAHDVINAIGDDGQAQLAVTV